MMTTSAATSAAASVPLRMSSSYCSSSSSGNTNHHQLQRRIRISFPPIIVSEAKSNPLFASSTSIKGRRQSFILPCEVALNTDASAQTQEEKEDEEMSRAKIGARVRVKVPQLKVYHLPKVPELDIAGMEGELKQYVGLWKGKRISANFPFKVEFFSEIEGRGRVKFFAHLKEDEFEYIS